MAEDSKKFLPINYTNREFTEIRSDLLEMAERYYPDTFQDFSEASFGAMMIDAVAYVGDQINFYLDYNINEAFLDTKHTPKPKYNTSVDKIPNRFELIRMWAKDRGIYDQGNSHTQYVKLQEEAGELAAALLNKDKPEIQDAIGDMIVVLTNLAELEGFEVEDCIDAAYTEIANRTGVMHNGTFVKTGTYEN